MPSSRRVETAFSYFLPVAGMPGFAPSLGRTLTDLRMASADTASLSAAGEGGRDLATLSEAARHQFDTGGTADRAALFAAAAEALESGAAFCRGSGVALIDVAITSDVERSFVAALVKTASDWIAVAPTHDERTSAALERCGAVIVETAETADDDLGRLRRYLFTTEAPALRKPSGQVTLYSAPGEGREAMEIARYALDEARRGVRFDEMAVLLRSPREYLGLLEHAFARAAIPAWFGRGTRRPHPAGRALLALLACADENLSAHRFAEYLSLAQVPDAVATPVEPPAPRRAVPAQPSLFQDDAPAEPVDDVLATTADRSAVSDEALAEPDLVPSAHESPDAPVVQGVVRAPYRWEEWLFESAVIAGRDRWTRLDGLAAEYRLRLREARRDDPHSPKVAGIERDLTHLEHLRGFALPLIREFDEWPDAAPWGEWLQTLQELVPRVIRQPVVVQRVLAELRPMGAIGPVTLREVREVLADRLRTVAVEPPSDRYGRVFVGLAEQARGRAFRVVFVPGLAERVFPQKVREDPLLSDETRKRVTADLETSSDRSRAERLLLRLAVGASTERLYLSYPAHRTARGPSARSVLLRSGRDARCDGPSPRPRGTPGRRRARDQEHAGLARARRPDARG